jgi:hypothetical protein
VPGRLGWRRSPTASAGVGADRPSACRRSATSCHQRAAMGRSWVVTLARASSG